MSSGDDSISIGDGMREVYCEPLLPPQRLVIFGAGDDVRPLVRWRTCWAGMSRWRMVEHGWHRLGVFPMPNKCWF